MLYTIQDSEGCQHVMAKRTYTTEEAGLASTNRFVQRTYTPTKVVTGAETKLADIQPNLTGKRKPVEVNQDSAGGDPTQLGLQDLGPGHNIDDATFALDHPIASYLNQNPPTLLGRLAGVISGSIDQGRIGMSLDSRAGNLDDKGKATGEEYAIRNPGLVSPEDHRRAKTEKSLRENKQRAQEAALGAPEDPSVYGEDEFGPDDPVGPV